MNGIPCINRKINNKENISIVGGRARMRCDMVRMVERQTDANIGDDAYSAYYFVLGSFFYPPHRAERVFRPALCQGDELFASRPLFIWLCFV